MFDARFPSHALPYTALPSIPRLLPQVVVFWKERDCSVMRLVSLSRSGCLTWLRRPRDPPRTFFSLTLTPSLRAVILLFVGTSVQQIEPKSASGRGRWRSHVTARSVLLSEARLCQLLRIWSSKPVVNPHYRPMICLFPVLSGDLLALPIPRCYTTTCDSFDMHPCFTI